jgi:hypothetical protein
MKKLVRIEWRDPENDWPWFWLLELRGEWVYLQGANYPDGSCKHDGNRFWVHHSEIKLMEEIDNSIGETS